jgi:hypothetical protein
VAAVSHRNRGPMPTPRDWAPHGPALLQQACFSTRIRASACAKGHAFRIMPVTAVWYPCGHRVSRHHPPDAACRTDATRCPQARLAA